MNIFMGSDHAGFRLKKELETHLTEQGLTVIDLGTETTVSCDYVPYALKVAKAVVGGQGDLGILICGTGLGMAMAANRIKGTRAALCTNEYLARMSRAHNDANILCLGERVVGLGLARSIADVWLNTEFEGGRHIRRLEQLDQVT